MLAKVGLMAGVALALMAATASATTIKVDTLSDELNGDADCSLREAVQTANTNSAVSGCEKGQNSNRDTIKLEAQDYPLLTSTNEGSNANGDFDVAAGGPLTIAGKGTGDTRIIQSGDDRVFDVLTSADLTVTGMRISGGDVTSFDTANGRGGNLRVTDAKLTLANVEVAGGDAFVGGAVHANNSARINISKALFDSNDATGVGGSLSLQSGAKGTVKRTTFQLSDVTNATGTGEGGAILSAGGGLKLFDSTVQSSGVDTSGVAHSALGAAIYSVAPLEIRRSTIRGNTTSADTDNTSEHGGGVYVSGDEALIVNSTFFDNRAGGPGDNDGDGGAIYNSAGQVEVKHVTFDSNIGTDEGDTLSSVSGNLNLFGSIIDDAPDPCSGGTVLSDGFNVSESIDANCNFVGSDVPGGDPGLGSFADNGGFTETIAIAPTSDAKNLVPKSQCKPATGLEDQRGFKRPNGKKCDGGAFELGANP
jgi:CSLREA domain-containing protein